MKKALTLLLVVIMCVGLFAACKKPDEPATSTPPSVSNAATATPPSSAPDSAKTTDVSVPTSAVPVGTVGYIDDDVDHYSRKTYEIVYLADAMMFLQQSWLAAMKQFEERLNVKVTPLTGNGDIQLYLQTIEIIASEGYDGVIIDCPIAYSARAYEMLEEYKITYLAFVQSFINDDKKTVCPQVVLDQYDTGKQTIDWLIENYKSYIGDIDTSKLGLIDIGILTSPDLAERAVAPEEIFKATFPNGTFFFCDAVTAGGVSADAATVLVSATVSAHPEITYWWVTGCVEFFGVGAARALEELGKTDTSMICVVGAGSNIVDWQSLRPDQKTPLVACLMIPDLLYGAPAVAGLVALIDGRATPETLWKEKTPANYKFGMDYGVWLVECKVVTRENYMVYEEEINKKYLETAGH